MQQSYPVELRPGEPKPSDVLMDWRYVYVSYAPTKTEHPWLKDLRSDRKKNPSAWLREYNRMEEAYRKEVKEWEKEQKEETDVVKLVEDASSAKTEEMIGQLLREYRESKKDVPGGKVDGVDDRV